MTEEGCYGGEGFSPCGACRMKLLLKGDKVDGYLLCCAHLSIQTCLEIIKSILVNVFFNGGVRTYAQGTPVSKLRKFNLSSQAWICTHIFRLSLKLGEKRKKKGKILYYPFSWQCLNI